MHISPVSSKESGHVCHLASKINFVWLLALILCSRCVIIAPFIIIVLWNKTGWWQLLESPWKTPWLLSSPLGLGCVWQKKGFSPNCRLKRNCVSLGAAVWLAVVNFLLLRHFVPFVFVNNFSTFSGTAAGLHVWECRPVNRKHWICTHYSGHHQLGGAWTRNAPINRPGELRGHLDTTNVAPSLTGGKVTRALFFFFFFFLWKKASFRSLALYLLNIFKTFWCLKFTADAQPRWSRKTSFTTNRNKHSRGGPEVAGSVSVKGTIHGAMLPLLRPAGLWCRKTLKPSV